MTGFKGHRPSGKKSWPLVVVAGADHVGKSYLTAEFTGSDLIGETFWIEYGEKTAEEYGDVPGARYMISDHDGTYRDLLRAAREAVDEPRRDGKPNCIVIDSVSVIWETLSAEMQAIANRRKKADPDDESQVTADLWNLARDRWKKLIRILKTHNGPVILLARLEIVAIMDAKGQPTTGKQKKIVAHKSLPYDADVIVQIPEYRRYQLTGVRSLLLQMPPGETFDVPSDFTLDALMRNLGLDAPGAGVPRTAVEARPDADDAIADATGRPEPVVTDPAWLKTVTADIEAAPSSAALNAIGGRIKTEAEAGRLSTGDGSRLRELYDARWAQLQAEGRQAPAGDEWTKPSPPQPEEEQDWQAADWDGTRASRPQLQKIRILMMQKRGLGKDRDAVIGAINAMLKPDGLRNSPITSSKELRPSEADNIIKALKAEPNFVNAPMPEGTTVPSGLTAPDPEAEEALVKDLRMFIDNATGVGQLDEVAATIKEEVEKGNVGSIQRAALINHWVNRKQKLSELVMA